MPAFSEPTLVFLNGCCYYLGNISFIEAALSDPTLGDVFGLQG